MLQSIQRQVFPVNTGTDNLTQNKQETKYITQKSIQNKLALVKRTKILKNKPHSPHSFPSRLHSVCRIKFKLTHKVLPTGRCQLQRRRGRGLALATWDWTCREPLSRGLAGEHRGAGRTHGMLRSTSALLRPGTQSRPQVVQLVPFSSFLHISAPRNL